MGFPSFEQPESSASAKGNPEIVVGTVSSVVGLCGIAAVLSGEPP